MTTLLQKTVIVFTQQNATKNRALGLQLGVLSSLPERLLLFGDGGGYWLVGWF